MQRGVAIATLVLGMCGGLVHAAERRTNAITPGDFYFGVKAGLMLPDAAALDNVINIGGNIGYTFPQTHLPFNGSLAAEGEVTLSALQGDVAGGGDWDIQSIGGYGVFRSGDALYFKGKAGIAHQRVNIDGTPLVANSNDTALSVGVGAGMRVRDSRVEVEYTVLDNINFVSVGYLF